MSGPRSIVRVLPAAFLAVLVAAGVAAEADSAFPAEREAVYRQMLKLRELVKGGTVEPHWMLDGRSFWYAQGGPANTQILRVDPASNSVTPLFDVGRLRAALTTFLGHEPANQGLPFTTFEFVDNERAVQFSAAGRALRMELASYQITNAEPSRAPRLVLPQSTQALALYGPAEVPARQGPRKAVFEAYNLHLRSSADGRSSALTTDGTQKYSWSLHPFSWSPRDDLLLVTRNDWRKVHFMPVVHWLQPNREEVSYSLYPNAGGSMEQTELYVIDVKSSARTRIDTGNEPDQQIWPLAWRSGGEEVVFMRADRLLKRLDLMAADVKTGRSRVLLTERQETFVEGVTLNPQVRPQNFYYPVGDSGTFVWRSERDGWSNLYLYTADGRLVRALTAGRAPVTDVATIDERHGWVYYHASGDESRPYDVHLYRVDLQGKRHSRLTDATGIHSAVFSPRNEYFLDSHSSIDRAPAVELRRSDGTLVRKLAQADTSALEALNWHKPEEFKAKSADGQTELHGVLYKPFDFDPGKRYPIVDLEYMGNFAHVVPRTFFNTRYGDDANALTQLGFIVYIVDGRGTPGRGKAFQDLTYKNIGRIEVPDHVAVLNQLAARHPYIDLTRAGITGFSWGGYFAIRAMLTEPDVFKVGVAGAPVVDLTAARHPIEPYMELPQQNPEGYEYASNVRLADRLKGKLMIAIGTADTNATFGATMRMSDALIRAGKRFDLVVLPEQPHFLSGAALAYYYEARNRYLVEHLRP